MIFHQKPVASCGGKGVVTLQKEKLRLLNNIRNVGKLLPSKKTIPEYDHRLRYEGEVKNGKK